MPVELFKDRTIDLPKVLSLIRMRAALSVIAAEVSLAAKYAPETKRRGILAEKPDHLVFNQDAEFSSPQCRSFGYLWRARQPAHRVEEQRRQDTERP